MERDRLFGKSFRPLVRVFFIDLQELLFVISHPFPFGTILRSLRQVHFGALEIRAGEHHAHTKRIRGIPSSKLLDNAREISLINCFPLDRNRQFLSKIGTVWVVWPW